MRPPRGASGRNISTEERELFHSALKDVRPLRRKPQRLLPDKPVKGSVPQPHFPRAPAHGGDPAPLIGGHQDVHLRRGRHEPDARIDLHGLSHDTAYSAALRFLSRAQAEGKRLVLVITGKGGVLRARLPYWLGQSELKPLIAGVREAHIRHGGSGAFYVLLRRHEWPQARQ